MPPTRRLAEEPSERAARPPEPVPEEPALQRSAGNAVGGLDDWAEAGLRVDGYFDEVAKEPARRCSSPDRWSDSCTRRASRSSRSRTAHQGRRLDLGQGPRRGQGGPVKIEGEGSSEGIEGGVSGSITLT